MTTESPMRLVGSGGARKWLASEEAATLTSSTNNVAAQELGLLLRGQRFRGSGRDMVPNRSGSAPPSMEGSFAAIGNLVGQQNPSMGASWASLNKAIENSESEEQLRADPAYLAYYYSNVNLNPRLPPPLTSRENRRLAHHIGVFGDNRRFTSFDDSSNESLFSSQTALSTHKEEPEEDRSPVGSSVGEPCNDRAQRSTEFLFGQLTSSLAGRHKSLVDLIQEDFPRTPSPVYSQSRSSGQAATEEAVDHDAHLNLLRDSSINTVKLPESNTVSSIRASTPALGAHVVSVSNTDPSTSPPVPSLSSADQTVCPQQNLQVDSSTGDMQLEDDVLVGSVTGSDITSMEATLKGLSISNLPRVEGHKRQQERHQPQQTNLQQYHLHQQRGTASQGLPRSHSLSDQLPYGSKFSSPNTVPTVEVLQSGGITPQLYASTTGYMASGNPFYPNLQPSSIFAPQYSLGGFALNTTLLPPVIAGYPPPHGSIPMAFDNSSSPSFNARAAGGSAVASVQPGIDLQHLYKFYGLAVQPSFADPLYMHYMQHPSDDGYNAAGGPYEQMVSGGGLLGGLTDAFDSQKLPPLAGYMADQKPQYLPSGAVSVPIPRKGAFASPSYYGSPPNMGLLMQYPSSPLASPVLPASPMAGASLPGRKNDYFGFQLGSNRNAGAYSGWQGQRGTEKFDDAKSYSFLEELKSNKARRFELSDIAGRIVEFSADQHGSRFIQQKLETCSAEEKTSVFEEVLPHASSLMTDVFGNYVIQKFFEHGSSEQRKALANQLAGHILPLSLQMYGCRVIQKALEVIELDQKTQLVLELDGHVMRCVRDQNGNHVIQKCIECVPTERIEFIISAFRGQVVTLSTHPYGCRVIQRVLEHCTNEQQSQGIVDEILHSVCALAQDQYGNYVTQHVLERGKFHERTQIISKLAGQVVQMSQHKFASNVIEKCLEYADPSEQELMIEEILGQTEGNDNLLIMMISSQNYVVQKILETCTDKQQDILLDYFEVHLRTSKKYTYGKHIVARTMMKDQFANYVVQKILEICTDRQREILLDRIKVHLHALKKYTYGKHIVARVEQLSGEEAPTSEAQ